MKETTSERRLAENEVIFRQLNQQVYDLIEETNKFARDDHQPEYLIQPKSDDEPIKFLCECADEKCSERVIINMRDYEDIHKQNNRFVIIPGHQVALLERVILVQPYYMVVEKNVEPPKTATKLNPTSLHNT
ncbi:MAG TPA: hypothetical protein VLF79_02570 [Candidatus Saccharimonadales bacterium]|nr:hypothetical protein [Candidatus Saccharimonadales bacterium]